MAAKIGSGEQSEGGQRESAVAANQASNPKRHDSEALLQQLEEQRRTFGVLQLHAEALRSAVLRCSMELQEEAHSLAEEMRKVPLEQRRERSLLLDFERRSSVIRQKLFDETELGWT
ncbi:MAG TPA: hypothetical protein VK447_15295 [Myxococcaceae bacterium]|nr:hypothetical protein [Myxococcaceae bacterium]